MTAHYTLAGVLMPEYEDVPALTSRRPLVELDGKYLSPTRDDWADGDLVVVQERDIEYFRRVPPLVAGADVIREGDVVWTAHADFAVTCLREQWLDTLGTEFKSWGNLGSAYVFRTGSHQDLVRFSNRLFTETRTALRRALYSPGSPLGEAEICLTVLRGLPNAPYKDALLTEALYHFRRWDRDAFDLISAESVDAGHFDSQEDFLLEVRRDDAWSRQPREVQAQRVGVPVKSNVSLDRYAALLRQRLQLEGNNNMNWAQTLCDLIESSTSASVFSRSMSDGNE